MSIIPFLQQHQQLQKLQELQQQQQLQQSQEQQVPEQQEPKLLVAQAEEEIEEFIPPAELDVPQDMQVVSCR